MIDIQGKLWLAPLAGVTDNIYRTICKKWGAANQLFTAPYNSTRNNY